VYTDNVGDMMLVGDDPYKYSTGRSLLKEQSFDCLNSMIQFHLQRLMTSILNL